ncbi:hypothetical protein [Tissierella praeacuta]|uniref:hypothetical protein n=1 Tax=Tissierella praeacuta TaxID=43131 RepID=UPI0033410852
MNYSQIEQIMLSYGLKKHEISEGTNFTYTKKGKHRIILERLRLLTQGGVGGFLYVELLDEYKNICSKNGHINVKGIGNEEELRNIVEKIINVLETSWKIVIS